MASSWRRTGRPRWRRSSGGANSTPARGASAAATVAQARVMLASGVRRMLIANEVTDPPAVRWIAAQLRDPGVEILCAVRFTERRGAARGGARRGARGPRRSPSSWSSAPGRADRMPQRRGWRARGGPPREDGRASSRWRARPGSKEPSATTARRRASTRAARSSTGSRRSPARLRTDGASWRPRRPG